MDIEVPAPVKKALTEWLEQQLDSDGWITDEKRAEQMIDVASLIYDMVENFVIENEREPEDIGE